MRQACLLLPCFAGHYPLTGSRVVGDRACGIGIREDASPITQGSSRFLPHFILD
ncbi:glutathionylspermidine synthase family protein [Azotobacter armeniacus]